MRTNLLIDVKNADKRRTRLPFLVASLIYSTSGDQLDEKAVIASFAYDAPAYSISINAGRVFWHIAFWPNKMWSSVNTCQNVFIAPKNVSLLICHKSLYRNGVFCLAIC